MPLIHPFAALRPSPEYAGAVLAPPADALSRPEAARRVIGRPWSLLHVCRAEIDMPQNVGPHDAAAYRRAEENFCDMLAEGVLLQDDAPCIYVYRLMKGTHVQTGVAAAVPVAACEGGRIRGKVSPLQPEHDDPLRLVQVLGAQTEPVFLAYPADVAVDDMLARITRDLPIMDVTDGDGVRHSLWAIDDSVRIASITDAFKTMDAIYLLDGHQHAAAAARLAALRLPAKGGGGGRACDFFLGVMFPHDRLRMLGCNIGMEGLNGMRPADFVAHVAEFFDIRLTARMAYPAGVGQFGMYLGGDCYRMRLREAWRPDEPAESMDVSQLLRHVIDPLLGIRDAVAVGGVEVSCGPGGMKALQERADRGELAVVFALHPAPMQQWMAVADAGQAMPPWSACCFDPRPADGIVSYLID